MHELSDESIYGRSKSLSITESDIVIKRISKIESNHHLIISWSISIYLGDGHPPNIYNCFKLNSKWKLICSFGLSSKCQRVGITLFFLLNCIFGPQVIVIVQFWSTIFNWANWIPPRWPDSVSNQFHVRRLWILKIEWYNDRGPNCNNCNNWRT